jgi:hypothetical protein
VNGNGPGVQQTFGNPMNQTEQDIQDALIFGGALGQDGAPLTGGDGVVYMGSDYEEAAQPGTYIGSTYGSGRKGTAMFPIDRAVEEYYYLDDEQMGRLVNQTSRLIGYDARRQPSMLLATWRDAVTGAAAYGKAMNEQISPFEWLQQQADRMERLGQGRRAGGGGGARAIVNLTNPADAQVLVDGALQQVLGRAASPEERGEFLRALNQAERANPIVSGPGGSSGGTNRELIAQEFARSRDDAAEYLAETQYMGWLTEILAEDQFGGIESGL